MSEMDDDDDFYDEMSQDDYDEESDDCFDEPAVVQQDSLYKVLDEATCASLAQKQVVEVRSVTMSSTAPKLEDCPSLRAA